MKVEIKSELETAHRKILLAQTQVDRFLKAGQGKRSEQAKYWTEQLEAWTGYANELNQLAQFEDIEITKTVMSSGAFHITATHNNRYIKNVNKDHIPAELLEQLTTGNDYSRNNPHCRRCGALGTELHHWGPKELFFDEAETWPQDYLCLKCHNEWHKVVTIPFRTLRRKEAKDVKPAA